MATAAMAFRGRALQALKKFATYPSHLAPITTSFPAHGLATAPILPLDSLRQFLFPSLSPFRHSFSSSGNSKDGEEELESLNSPPDWKTDLTSILSPNESDSRNLEPLTPEEIPEDFFTGDVDTDMSDDEFYSMMLMQDLEGVPGLPPLKELREMDEGAEQKAARRELELMKQEEIRKSRVRQVDEWGRSYATGRRKCSVARVWIQPGQGKFVVNGKTHDIYFPELDYRTQLLAPFSVTQTLGAYDVWSTVKGGGRSGQAGALRHGISQALQLAEPSLRPPLKSAGFLTRDPRVVERKKPGKAKARKSFQWVKR